MKEMKTNLVKRTNITFENLLIKWIRLGHGFFRWSISLAFCLKTCICPVVFMRTYTHRILRVYCGRYAAFVLFIVRYYTAVFVDYMHRRHNWPEICQRTTTRRQLHYVVGIIRHFFLKVARALGSLSVWWILPNPRGRNKT